MRESLQHFIDGEWVDSTKTTIIDVINPATEEVIGKISDGTKEDLDKAVAAARAAFPSFAQTTVDERVGLLNRIADEYERRKQEIIEVVTEELGSPVSTSEKFH